VFEHLIKLDIILKIMADQTFEVSTPPRPVNVRNTLHIVREKVRVVHNAPKSKRILFPESNNPDNS